MTPQALAKELNINASVIYGWITKGTIGFKELAAGRKDGTKRYLVNKVGRPELRERGRPNK